MQSQENTMFLDYRDFIERYVSLNFLEWSIIKSKLKIIHYKKGDILHNIGDVPSNLMFIHSGLARSYLITENGKDLTWVLHFNDRNSHIVNLFVVDYDAFIHQKESRLEIEALEDCEVISTNFEDIEYIYKHTKKGDSFGRYMAQEAYSFLHNLMISKQTKSAKERFDEFMKTTPYLLDKVPQYHTATYLGITPQHLSRLKKEFQD